MAIYSKINGTWSEQDNLKFKINDEWNDIDSGYVKVNGAWEEFYSSAPPLPVKGDIIYLDSPNELYRVIYIDGNVARLQSLFAVGQSPYHSSMVTSTFPTDYNDTVVHNFLTTWKNTKAWCSNIVNRTIPIYNYKYNYNSSSVTYTAIDEDGRSRNYGKEKLWCATTTDIYPPFIEDIYTYYGTDTIDYTQFSNYFIYKLSYLLNPNVIGTYSRIYVLRQNSESGWFGRSTSEYKPTSTDYVQASFDIDLSQVSWAPVEIWKFNDTIDVTQELYFSGLSFTSNNETFTVLSTTAWDGGAMMWNTEGSQVYTPTYYGATGWENENYKTIVLEGNATGDLLTYLQANATKQ